MGHDVVYFPLGRDRFSDEAVRRFRERMLAREERGERVRIHPYLVEDAEAGKCVIDESVPRDEHGNMVRQGPRTCAPRHAGPDDVVRHDPDLVALVRELGWRWSRYNVRRDTERRTVEIAHVETDGYMIIEGAECCERVVTTDDFDWVSF